MTNSDSVMAKSPHCTRQNFLIPKNFLQKTQDAFIIEWVAFDTGPQLAGKFYEPCIILLLPFLWDIASRTTSL